MFHDLFQYRRQQHLQHLQSQFSHCIGEGDKIKKVKMQTPNITVAVEHAELIMSRV